MIHCGHCTDVLRTYDDATFDAVVTDPPYGLRFMGRKWDYDVPSVDAWREVLRALKPGGHLLCFAGTRTQHRMAVNIEDAGFEIRDMLAWVYGSGFPKSRDVSKDIDKSQGATRGVVGESPYAANRTKSTGSTPFVGVRGEGRRVVTAPATELAKRWQGWGTALKPALEPITLARKPFKGSVASNVLEHGVGAINVDGCRVETSDDLNGGTYSRAAKELSRVSQVPRNGIARDYVQPSGRWPANLIHDGSDEVTDLLGNAARFFYCAKASKKERDAGLDDVEPRKTDPTRDARWQRRLYYLRRVRNDHPTVKPIALMRYLVRLITPPGGTLLDPYCGSGSTLVAAKLEGFNAVGIDCESEYVEIARRRVDAA